MLLLSRESFRPKNNITYHTRSMPSGQLRTRPSLSGSKMLSAPTLTPSPSTWTRQGAPARSTALHKARKTWPFVELCVTRSGAMATSAMMQFEAPLATLRPGEELVGVHFLLGNADMADSGLRVWLCAGRQRRRASARITLALARRHQVSPAADAREASHPARCRYPRFSLCRPPENACAFASLSLDSRDPE
jgi:hypothetical protein